MKIAFFTDSYFPYISGVSASIRFFSKGLASKGNEVLILAPGDKNKTIYEDDARKIRVEYISALNLKKLYPDFKAAKPRIPQNLKIIKEFNPDIIHFHTPFIMGAEAIMYGKLLKKKVVGTFHGYFMEPEYLKIVGIEKNNVITNGISSFLWKYNNIFYSKADLVITPSRYVGLDLKKHGVKTRIEEVNNPIDIKQIKNMTIEKREDLKKKYWLGDKVFLYVGRLSQEKLLSILFLAFKKALEKDKSYQLLLIGSGPMETELRNLAVGLGIERSIIFMGKVDHEKLIDEGYYSLGNVFVSSSTSEVQPMSFIEAMAFGLPLLVTKARGNIEMIQGNGILFDNNNIDEIAKKMSKLMDNKKLREKLGGQSLKVVQKYSIESASEKLLKAYEEVL